MELNGKVIVVTGGARGIGRALCERFAMDRPTQIVVVDLEGSAAKEVAACVNGVAMEADVANEVSMRKLIENVEATHGPIDLFCANAGIATVDDLDASNQLWERTWQVNVMAHVYSARILVPRMLARGGGYLLHTASAAGLLTQIASAPYAVSKHAAVAYAEWLAITYGRQGLKVSCLCPQGEITDMVEGNSPVLAMLRETAVTPQHVADCVVQGLQSEEFLILPHPEVRTYLQNKAKNYDRWIGGMRKLSEKLVDS